MDSAGIIPAVFCTLIALACVAVMARWIEPPPLSNRFASIDGLRGYLGFAVFLHHADIWHGFALTGEWSGCSSRLYILFGSTSVVLFFMITSFLFVTKILNDRKTEIDFFQLLASRVFRLAPLYFLAITVLLVFVGIKTEWHLVEPISHLLKNIAQWYGFTIFGDPALNGLSRTDLVMSGVYWTLPYEWVFYLSLPLIALAVGTKKSLSPYLILSALALWLATDRVRISVFFPFIGGAVAALLVRVAGVRNFSRTSPASYLGLLFLAMGGYAHLESHEIVSIAFLSAGFTLIAAGNTFFGLLTHRLSRMLGEFTYSIYLLHGFLLYAIFNLMMGPAAAKLLTPIEYWGTIMAVTPILIAMTAFTFYFIEHPAMKLAKPFTRWVRSGTKRDAVLDT